MARSNYLPHTPEDVRSMLDVIGVATVNDLYSAVPEQLRLKAPYALPERMSEPELRRYFAAIAAKNTTLICFAGAGFYNHATPAAVESLMARSEFLTAYTPYQPEISQGTLQYIFEYQTMMARLTGLDVSNASMYDGSTATAEAMMMAVAASRRRKRVLVSATVDPMVREVLATYAEGGNVILEEVPQQDGVTSRESMRQQLGAGDVAGVIVASPNYYGIIEDFSGVADEVHQAKALLIMNCHASPLGVLRTPGEWGADIACGEAQSLGMPLNYGGPYLGYLCTTRALMRKMPGRIVGATTDADGHTVYVLTLQAREQHIRRQKASSNICSNQGIMTLHAAIYLSLMGDEGLRRVNARGADAAHSLADGLCATGKMELAYPDKPFLNEFLMRIAGSLDADRVLAALRGVGILGGVKVEHDLLLVAATEMCTPKDIKLYINTVAAL